MLIYHSFYDAEHFFGVWSILLRRTWNGWMGECRMSVVVTLLWNHELWKYWSIIKNKLQYCKTKRRYVLQWLGSRTLLNSSKPFPIYDLRGSGSWCAKTVIAIFSGFWLMTFLIKSISRSDGFGFYINRRR